MRNYNVTKCVLLMANGRPHTMWCIGGNIYFSAEIYPTRDRLKARVASEFVGDMWKDLRESI